MSDTSELDRKKAPRKIRGKHRRRILSILAKGDATVSEISLESNLRMPHVSAEVKRMRDDGIASSDLPPGSRGARMTNGPRYWNYQISPPIEKAAAYFQEMKKT